MAKGNCYAASEALYHLLGGKRAGWTPMQMTHEGVSHWFLKHRTGLIIDPTRNQFSTQPGYIAARGRGFLTKHPSVQGRKLMNLILWKND